MAMKHVMLDLETMGKESNAAIVAIGACFFEPSTGEIGSSIHLPISLESSVAAGLSMDASTVLWWMKQNDDARFVLGHEECLSLFEATAYFCEWIGQFDNLPQLEVWGNGCNFDNVILRNAMVQQGLEPPWKFWQDRDVRTVVSLGEMVGVNPKDTLVFEGTKHNALADAMHQARYVSVIFAALGLGTVEF